MNGISKIGKFAACLCLCACIFAGVMLTPLSGVISGALAGRLAADFGRGSGAGADFGRALLSAAGFSGAGGLSASAGAAPAVPVAAREPELEHGGTYMFVSESIMSVPELYERYAGSGGVSVEEAPPETREAPPGKFRITPRNFSVQADPNNIRLLINNETSFNIGNANISEFLERPFPVEPFDLSMQSEPVVLIVHAHSTESLMDAGAFYYYPPFTAERTTDTSRNIVLVGRELKNTLRAYNIPVVHSERIHDYPSFRDSYRRALETINEYLARHPSIRYVLDVHRDSIIAPNGEKFRPVIKINGRETAQVMIVTGTDGGGANHPNWRDNLAFSARLQQLMNERYPMLARPINLRNQRFNQHAAPGSIILEIGSCGSSFDEALRAARLVGSCLAELILANNQ